MKKTPIFKDGEYQGAFKCTGKKRKRLSLGETRQKHARIARDKRLLEALKK